MAESSSAQIHPITGEPIHRTIPLLVARLVHHDDQIEEIRDHQREILAARSESDMRIKILEQDLETVRSRAEASEARLQQNEAMATMNQGLSIVEIKQIIAQRVANAIETIAIYETATCMAHDLMNQVERQEDKVAENASNKRKWESDHDGSSSQQQNKGHKVIRAHVVGPSNKKVYTGKLPYCNTCKFHHTRRTAKCGKCKRIGHLTKSCRASVHATTQRPMVATQKTEVTCYEYRILGHYKSDCPKWKNQNPMNKSNVMAYDTNV
ncbi:reverse transcriptase domain-containing protein [Tanacetum coccineum]